MVMMSPLANVSSSGLSAVNAYSARTRSGPVTGGLARGLGRGGGTDPLEDAAAPAPPPAPVLSALGLGAVAAAGAARPFAAGPLLLPPAPAVGAPELPGLGNAGAGPPGMATAPGSGFLADTGGGACAAAAPAAAVGVPSLGTLPEDTIEGGGAVEVVDPPNARSDASVDSSADSGRATARVLRTFLHEQRAPWDHSVV